MEKQSESPANEKKKGEEVSCEPILSGKISFPAYVGQTNEANNKVQAGVLTSDYYCKTSWIRPKLGIPDLNKVHFYNVNRVEPPLWSCAIDSFLEICYVVICPYIEKISERYYFFSFVFHL